MSTTSMSPAPASKIRGRRRQLGPYELLKKLGQGAMGAVYLARHEQTGQKVALKVLPPDMAEDHEFLERFRREMRAMVRLRHPNVVAAYDVGEVDGFHYIAMEFVDGEDLEDGFRHFPNKRYPAAEIIKIARSIAHALAAASELGIVHRDIKPANILKDENGHYKLTDLGLAARVLDDERVTQTGLAVGTPYYISPEQAQGYENVDVRADIYSLGATLYHLATGQLPFPDENAVVVMTRHVQEELRPPSELIPDLPKPICRLIVKMMAKRPADRHKDAKELLADIEGIAKGEVPHLKRARATKAGTSLNPSMPPAVVPPPPAVPAAARRPESRTAGELGAASGATPSGRKRKPQLASWKWYAFWAGLTVSAILVGFAVRALMH
ncbi:MAG: serine/threonine protein kinase [Planctomycetes bacterium]|nr:serine/threonine protein kinase [Planctomycetota bacterium]